MNDVKVVVTIAPEQIITQQLIDEIKVKIADIDIVELRIDQLHDVSKEAIRVLIKDLRSILNQQQLLVTYRTNQQGGKGNLLQDDYINLLYMLAETKDIDIIDIEWDQHIDVNLYQHMIATVQPMTKVILSHHNFDETPTQEELNFIYYKMQKFQPDYVKVAVMPQDKDDVIKLLQAMSLASQSISSKVVGISMSHLGLVSRTAQGVFGGSLTYGCLGEPQAPGQIDVSQLSRQIALYTNK
ncbi:type I 3-dehydroquinate dehydratase [Staphylococcus simiae]|uniref:type I 3-dehydroquinate dehydratase n=1 Tax=Staphylococcus simiae TaxID=308354 RepID=UPI001A96610B|nr:type I 3-dehydroquinate dehydratase [Staphylococcus simiae]MBO1199888.1 type I 3-dehydroquinate dehydratase [Staphylococcus simiae]MBO1202167.1 type I 3-dehydroquinate dehydratase [Staphylococcus simiae]MBO1204425.1 type I 3-dehydroquinate dehydratase [Staphylococcus simiae]MBO1211965.1 type I 3-dehydroquinate dehydratase [Staphylococcus simiae]MBO1230610.1 type I 3-dehydroquinate dehydratase [Staphylococcus simiae]